MRIGFLLCKPPDQSKKESAHSTDFSLSELGQKKPAETIWGGQRDRKNVNHDLNQAKNLSPDLCFRV